MTFKENQLELELELTRESAPPDLVGKIPASLAYNPKKLHWWYERLADWMLQNPEKWLKDAAVVFDTSVQYLYTIKNSDTFQDYYQKRSQQVCASVEQKARVLADRLLDSFQQDLDQADALQVPMRVNERLQILDLTMKRFGYGGNGGNGGKPSGGVPVVNINQLGVVTSEELSSARDRLAEKGQQRALQRAGEDA